MRLSKAMKAMKSRKGNALGNHAVFTILEMRDIMYLSSKLVDIYKLTGRIVDIILEYASI